MRSRGVTRRRCYCNTRGHSCHIRSGAELIRESPNQGKAPDCRVATINSATCRLQNPCKVRLSTQSLLRYRPPLHTPNAASVSHPDYRATPRVPSSCPVTSRCRNVAKSGVSAPRLPIAVPYCLIFSSRFSEGLGQWRSRQGWQFWLTWIAEAATGIGRDAVYRITSPNSA
jgi:hypothetical protein